MLLVPLGTGAVVGSVTAAHAPALLVFLLLTLTIFWLRTPLEAWLGTTPIKAHSVQERTVVRSFAIALTLLSAVGLALLFAMGLGRGLVLVGSAAAAAFVLQAGVKRLGRAGRMPAQVIGAMGLTSSSAAAYYVCTGRLSQTAFALWLVNWLFAANQIQFVQVRIKASRLSGWSAKLQHEWQFMLAQVLLLCLVLAIMCWDALPALAVLAFIPALVRGFAWYVRATQPLDVHKLGFSELAHAIAFGFLLCLAYLY